MNMRRARVKRWLKFATLLGLVLTGTALMLAGMFDLDVRLLAMGLFAWILAVAFITWLNRGIGLLMLERQHFALLELDRHHAETRARFQSAARARGQLKYAVASTRADFRASTTAAASQLDKGARELRASMEVQQKDLVHLMLRTFRAFDAGSRAAAKQGEADRAALESLLNDHFATLELRGREVESRQHDTQELLLRSFRALDASLEAQARAGRTLQEEGHTHLSESSRLLRAALQRVEESAAARLDRLDASLSVFREQFEPIYSHHALLPEVSGLQQELLREAKLMQTRVTNEFAEARRSMEVFVEMREQLKNLHAEFSKQSDTVAQLTQVRDIDTRVHSSLAVVAKSKPAMALARQLFDHVKPDVVMEIAAMSSLRERAPKIGVSPPMTRFSMEPSAILAVVENVVETGPGLIVELGSGASTIWIAGALAHLGRGRLISYDHDPHYLSQTKAWLRANGLEDWVDLRLAEIKPRILEDGAEVCWYDIAQHEVEEGIEILLVDGPPQGIGTAARLPALQHFRSRFAVGARIFVDDATRGEEKSMVEQWRGSEPRLSKPRVVAGRMVAMTLTS